MRMPMGILTLMAVALGTGWPGSARGQSESDASSPASPAAFTLTCVAIELVEPISFDAGRDTLDPAGRARVRELASLLLENDWIERLRVEVHSDSSGSAGFNFRLTQKRAEQIVAELQRHGVGRDRLEARAAGEREPIAENTTAEGRAQNRRVTLVVVASECPLGDESGR
jgi:outer membrane protein OmpA-like peptidoglycan-associated protein